MSFKASFVLVFFVLSLLEPSIAHESHAELYWKAMLGNITMPRVLKTSLLLGTNEVKLNPQFKALQYENNNYYHTSYVRKNPVPKDGRVEYFTDDELFVGTKMMLHFNRIDDGSKFLPMHIAKSLDLTSNKLESILNTLLVNTKSIEAKYIANMILHCEEKALKDEVRYCATSLKAVVDFSLSILKSKKNNFMVASTEVENEVLMEYTIQNAQKLGNDDQHNVECHKMNTPFGVFFCHNIKSTDIYKVSLVGANGKNTNAIAVCHKKNSEWVGGFSDQFEILNLKPGSKPICHFLSGDSVVWFQNKNY